MSGEAGHALDGRHYTLFVGTGVNVSVAVPPGDDGSAVGDHFAAASAPYRAWLERARPALDRLFDQVIGEGLPLVDRSRAADEIDGAIIEDLDPSADRGDHFRAHHRGEPCPVTVRGTGQLGVQSLVLTVTVSTRVERSRLDELVARVAEVLRAHEAAPQPAPGSPAGESPAAGSPPIEPAVTAPRKRWWHRLGSILRYLRI